MACIICCLHLRSQWCDGHLVDSAAFDTVDYSMLLLRLEDRMVSVAPQSAGSCPSSMPYPLHSLWRFEVNPSSSVVWGLTRIGPWTNPISPIHCRSAAVGRVPWVVCTFVCWPLLRLLPPGWYCSAPKHGIDKVAMWSNQLHINADRSKVLCFISTLATPDPWRATFGALRYCDKEFGLCEISASVLTPTSRYQLK